MHSADYAVARYLSVCSSVGLSVCLSHADIVCKRLYISSKFFHFRVAPAMAIFRPGPPNGASNARSYEKITIFDEYLALSWKSCKLEP